MADRAARRGAKKGVMPGYMPGDAPDHGAGETPGLSGARSGKQNHTCSENFKCLCHDAHAFTFVPISLFGPWPREINLQPPPDFRHDPRYGFENLDLGETILKLANIAGAVAAGLWLTASYAAMAADTPAGVAAAVADAARPATETALDATRKPAELISFMGLKPGMSIVDIFPGPYWDRMFSTVVGPKGSVIAYQSVEMAKAENDPLPPDGSAPMAGHPNLTARSGPINGFAVAKPVDVIWMRQNYHDLYDPFMGPADVPAFNKAVFKALKPGGAYVIIDHSAPDGSGLAATNTTHRIDAAVVKKDMAAAGFVFVGESDVLRNPADARDKLVFDKAIRGHTDQFVYLFRKP